MTPARYSAWAERRETDCIAVGDGGERTFGELCADAHRIAALLPAPAASGKRPSAVLVACADRYMFTAALLASWMRGHCAALPPSHRPKALQEVAHDSAAAAILHDGEAEHGIDLRVALANSASRAHGVPRPLPGDSAAVMLYTSGSRGMPEPILKRAAQLLGEVDLLATCFGADLRRVICTVPPRHIYGLLFGALLPLRAGGAFVRETPLHTDAVLELVRRYGADTLVAVPAHLQGLERAEKEGCGPLHRVFSSGAPLPSTTFDALVQGLALSVFEVFGSTETGGIGYRARSSDPYRPFPDVRVQAGADSELLVYSPRLAPELAQPYACEDRAEVLASGDFRHLGRSDDVAKIGGTRVSLTEIEQRVRALAGIRDAALFMRAVPGARQQEILLVAAGQGWDSARMREALSAWLPAVALPRRYRFVDELPREPTGKLRRDAALALFEKAPPVTQFEWLDRVRSQSDVRALVRPPAELVYFRGHFDEWPVLPGVAQLGLLAVREAVAAWPDLGALRRVRRLKFKRPIAPEQTLALSLVRVDDRRVDFDIEHDGALCSTGSLLFAGQETP
jgi:4-coumarate--CoA ligase (photoactive yellow protein activation family)